MGRNSRRSLGRVAQFSAFLFLAVACAFAADQPSGEKAYVTNSGGNSITVIDLKTMMPTAEIVVGEKVHGICAQADNRRIFTTIESEKNLKILDPVTHAITDVIPLTGRPNQCAATPNGKFVAVPIRDGDSVDLVDISQKKVVKVLPLKLPHNCYNTGDDHQMYCSSMGDKFIERIDLDTLSAAEQIPTPGIPRPFAVAKDGKTLFSSLTDLHGFVAVDIPSKKVIETVDFGPAPFDAIPMEANTPTHGMAISPDGKQLWLAGVVDDEVFVYDIAAKKVIRKIPAGHGPNWVGFSPDGKYCVVSNAGTNDASIYDTATYREVARVNVGKAPKRLLVMATPGR